MIRCKAPAVFQVDHEKNGKADHAFACEYHFSILVQIVLGNDPMKRATVFLIPKASGEPCGIGID